MLRALSVAVVVPAFNEQDRIVTTLLTIPRWVDHVIVVDDASDDATFARASQVDRPALRVLKHACNRGVGAAIATGYREALRCGVDVAVVMAGDGQMDPADLPGLIAPIADGRADYVKGNRFTAPSELLRAMPLSRLFGNVMLSLATKVASGHYHVFDSQCGYTAASRAALQFIDSCRMFPRYGYLNDLLGRLRQAGLRVVDAPVRPVYGPAWRSGIRIHRVVLPISTVLVRSFARRLRAA